MTAHGELEHGLRVSALLAILVVASWPGLSLVALYSPGSVPALAPLLAGGITVAALAIGIGSPSLMVRRPAAARECVGFTAAASTVLPVAAVGVAAVTPAPGDLLLVAVTLFAIVAIVRGLGALIGHLPVHPLAATGIHWLLIGALMVVTALGNPALQPVFVLEEILAGTSVPIRGIVSIGGAGAAVWAAHALLERRIDRR